MFSERPAVGNSSTRGAVLNSDEALHISNNSSEYPDRLPARYGHMDLDDREDRVELGQLGLEEEQAGLLGIDTETRYPVRHGRTLDGRRAWADGRWKVGGVPVSGDLIEQTISTSLKLGRHAREWESVLRFLLLSIPRAQLPRKNPTHLAPSKPARPLYISSRRY
jgi:hypothetical protein